MRDIALLGFFLFCIPLMIKRPWLGVVMWVWLSVMNPHRLTFGFAHDFQFALATAVVTFIGLVVTKDDRRLPLSPPLVLLFLFTLWMCITSLTAIHPDDVGGMWARVMKIMLMTFVAASLIHTRKQINWVIWTICFSLAYYGAKGGLFTFAHGGNFLVWGPEGSFIEGNNELALALVMAIPLMRYVQLELKKRWQRNAMSGVMLLCAFAAIGSHSRGALLAIAAMATFLWWKSRNKVVMAVALGAVAVAILTFMPAEWFARMHTIETYDQDTSALGRINAWWMAFNLAKANFFGGGFEIYDPDVFARYAPDPLDIHAAHSIYFQILGEHGFIGLFLFVAVGASTWVTAGAAKRMAKGKEDLAWLGPLMDMVKVSMAGYAVGGAFLSLAYFDVPYYLLVIVVAARVLAGQKTEVPMRDPFASRRGDRFGSVALDDGSPAMQPATPLPRPRDWRGQRDYVAPRLLSNRSVRP
jgi:probable O-glycosylation ligase (exosortase A-associated)